MRKLFNSLTFTVIVTLAIACAKTPAPEPLYPVPSENQMRWQEMEYYAFIHYSLNTYTDQSWGYGDEPLELFNPDSLDCRQWARICKEAGMKGIIFTAKHHCGFCMWPSEYTEYSVKNTPWKDGKGDVVGELADACREYGLEFGVYLSPWDRNHPEYGTPAYVEYFRNQLRELLTNYGPIFETWFDGAQGGTGYYGGAYETRNIDAKTYYQWKETFAMARELQPGILIWNDGGDRGDLRWVGTEAGFVGETNWSQLNKEGNVEWGMLHYGLEGGDSWVSAEVNTSIRPEWFYHESENTKVKTVPKLMETYYHSVGRNATLLLNVPVMPNGLIHPLDEERLKAFAQAREDAFADNIAYKARTSADKVRGGSRRFSASKVTDGKPQTYWTVDDDQKTGTITIDLGEEMPFNRFLVQEYIRLGQRVRSFTIEYEQDGEWKKIMDATTIGYKRILYFPTVSSQYIRFSVTDSRACPVISNIEVYRAPQILDAPAVWRHKDGKVSIHPVDAESEVYYTLDGSVPTAASLKYEAPFETEGRIEVNAVAYDPVTAKTSPVASASFDLPRTDWKVVGAEHVVKLFDGDPVSASHQNGNGRFPVSLTVDLGNTLNVKGFKYLPDPYIWGPGIITQYSFEVSTDGKHWQNVSEGEFSNIKNNPVEQTRIFPVSQARYVRLNAFANTENNTNIGYAEFNLITE